MEIEKRETHENRAHDGRRRIEKRETHENRAHDGRRRTTTQAGLKHRVMPFPVSARSTDLGCINGLEDEPELVRMGPRPRRRLAAQEPIDLPGGPLLNHPGTLPLMNPWWSAGLMSVTPALIPDVRPCDPRPESGLA